MATVTRAKRLRRESPHGLSVDVSSLVTPSTPGVWTHVVCSDRLPVPLPTTLLAYTPHWLGPRRHAEQQHLPEGPDLVGEPRRHGWRTRPPLLGRTAAVGRLGLGHGPAYARMGQTAIVVTVEHGHLLQQPVFALAQCADPSPDRGHLLPDGAVEPLHAGGVALPAMRSPHVIDGLQRAKNPTVTHPHQAPPAHGLDHLGIGFPIVIAKF